MRSSKIRAVEPLSNEAPQSLVLSFDIDWGATDARARAGVELLLEDARQRFFTPALQTSSFDQLLALWHAEGHHVFEILRSMDTLVRIAAGQPRERVRTQLVNADRRAADDLARKIEQVEQPELAARIRDANVLVSRARACASEAFNDQRGLPADVRHVYLVGVGMWSVGAMALHHALEAWLPGAQPRPELLAELTSAFVEAGAFDAGFAALFMSDVEIEDDESLYDSIADSGVINFVLEAVRRVREYFGPDATVTIDNFVEPDFDGPPSHLFHIETALPPENACDAFEHFCLQWWDGAAAKAGVDLHPILDVAR